eukprot:scaffold17821_cov139-Isochrysis_galbana.AAC.2
MRAASVFLSRGESWRRSRGATHLLAPAVWYAGRRCAAASVLLFGEAHARCPPCSHVVAVRAIMDPIWCMNRV